MLQHSKAFYIAVTGNSLQTLTYSKVCLALLTSVQVVHPYHTDQPVDALNLPQILFSLLCLSLIYPL